MADLARHTLAYIAPNAWATMVAAKEDATIRDWATAGRPAIVRRLACDDSPDIVPLGVPLPPALGKRRISLRCQPEAIVRTQPAPLLRDAAAVAPAGWQATIAALLLGVPDVRCFGSLAWQHLTGLGYLSENSDIDLILACGTAAGADDRASALATIENIAPMRIDAELITPAGGAVQWREWSAGAPEVLVKSLTGATMTARAAVFA
jgi:phosphoribosyl-dephospho-CoA transferase